MDKDYLQLALMTFNTDTPDWYGWKKEDDEGNEIPNEDRMQYKYVKIIKEGAIRCQVKLMLMQRYKS